MGDSVIAVPIHLDALYVKQPRHVAPATADFTRLPFFNGESDVNTQTPWLSEVIAQEPFSDTLVLKPGIHLHWRFPKALTHGVRTRDGKLVFPDLPDRWIITRGSDAGGNRRVEDHWAIDSNYLHCEEGSAAGSVEGSSRRRSHPGLANAHRRNSDQTFEMAGAGATRG